MVHLSRSISVPIVALDVSSKSDAAKIVGALGDACEFYKVGLQLFVAEGPRVLAWLREEGKRVFLDLKLHDIPNTVRGAAAEAAAHGAELLTVHASGGEAMLRAAVEGAAGRAGILAVTVLTSLDLAAYVAASGSVATSVEAEVLRLAAAAARSGARGVVCAGAESAAVRRAHPDFGVLVPGIRPDGAAAHDHARAVTASEAARSGATWVVLGRAVTTATDPRAAFAVISRSLGA